MSLVETQPHLSSWELGTGAVYQVCATAALASNGDFRRVVIIRGFTFETNTLTFALPLAFHLPLAFKPIDSCVVSDSHKVREGGQRIC